MSNQQPGKAKNLTVILLLIFFFPVGLYLMWAKTNWNKVVKIIISVYFGIMILFYAIGAIGGDSEPVELETSSSISVSTTANESTTKESTTKETTTESTTKETTTEKTTVATTKVTTTATTKITTTTERVTAATATVTKQVTTTKKQTTTQNATKSNGSTVYVTPTGKRYHLDPDCGGKNSHPATLDYAISLGLTPCQKCAS